MAKVVVLGAGSWGTALAVILAGNGNDVSLWARREEQVQSMRELRENKIFLPDVLFPEKLTPTTDISEVSNAEVLVSAVPSAGISKIAMQIKPFIKPNQILINVAKGFDHETLKRPSEIFEENLPGIKIGVLCGPSHAEEVGKGIPTTTVVAARDAKVAEYVQDLFMCPTLRVYVNDDIIGIEVGAALKNVVAISAGISDGMGFGDNSKAALMTRGISEIASLGVAMGARRDTFAGLAGIGDLIVTCISEFSRNRRAGILIGKGVPVSDALSQIGMVVEGYYTARAAHLLSKKFGVDMPISEQAYQILYEGKLPMETISALMNREKKHEIEKNWIS